MTIFDVRLVYRSHTKVQRRASLYLEATDHAGAKLYALAWFRSEFPELKNNALRIDGCHPQSGYKIYPQPHFIEDKTSHYQYDPEAHHKGRNKHKKGKWVPVTKRTKITRKVEDGPAT